MGDISIKGSSPILRKKLEEIKIPKRQKRLDELDPPEAKRLDELKVNKPIAFKKGGKV
jgi:hypothetical protein